MPALRIVTAGADRVVHGLAEGAETLHQGGVRVPVLPGGRQEPVDANPGHDLGVDVALRVAARLPDVGGGLVPDPLEIFDQRRLDLDAARLPVDPGAVRHVEAVEQLAVDVELDLVRGGVADQDGPRALVAGQPRRLVFRQAAPAVEPVHDLHPLRAAGDRPEDPVPPLAGLLGVAGIEQRGQREGRVAQPAIAVVPVHAAAGLLRQAERRGRQEPAGMLVDQRAQGDQRALDRPRPVARLIEPADPVGPFALGLGERPLRIGLRAQRVRRVGVDQREGKALPGGDLEPRGTGGPLVRDGDGGEERDAVGPHLGEKAVAMLLRPGRHVAVVEAQSDRAVHADGAANTFDDPDQRGARHVVARHEVDDADRPVLGRELGLQHQGIAAVAPGRARDEALRCEAPVPMAVVPQHGGEARAAVEARPT